MNEDKEKKFRGSFFCGLICIVIGLILLGIVLAIVAVICVAVTKSKNNEQVVVQNSMMQQPVMGQAQMMPQQQMAQPVQQPIQPNKVQIIIFNNKKSKVNSLLFNFSINL